MYVFNRHEKAALAGSNARRARSIVGSPAVAGVGAIQRNQADPVIVHVVQHSVGHAQAALGWRETTVACAQSSFLREPNPSRQTDVGHASSVCARAR